MRKILILGGTQFFGKRLVSTLLNNGDDVTIATRGKVQDPFGADVKRLKIDREDKESMVEAFLEKEWDVVYDQSCYSPLEMKDTLDALAGKVKKFVFTSTMAVYDFGTNHIEEDFDPYNYSITYRTRREYPGYEGYQEAKRAAEGVLFANLALKPVAVRFPIVIGKDDYTGRLEMHVNRVKNQEPIGISNLNARYSFILSQEAANFLYEIGKTDYIGPINPGCKEDISLGELLNFIGKQVGVEPIVSSQVTKENASPYSLPGSWSINTQKAEGLGFSFTDLYDSLEELVQYYK